MPDVGRNDPCPCGSGKKYKRCHLAVEERAPRPAPQRAQARHSIDQRIVSEMLRFASRYLPKWNPVAEFEDSLGGNADDAQLFAPWAVYHSMVDGRPVVDWYREQQGNRLSSDEVEWLAAQRRAWLSIWEVLDVNPGETVTVRDLLSGEERLVHEVSGSHMLVKRDAILGRVVDDEGISVLCGIHPRPLPPLSADAVVREARRELRVRTRPVSVERLRKEETTDLLIGLWYTVLEQLDHQPLPRLQNTDGEELLLCVDHFDIAPGAGDEIAARLRALEGAEALEEDGTLEVTFTRQGNAMHASWENTILGRAELAEGRLKIETNSNRRADLLRRKIEEACTGLLVHRVREHDDPAALLAQAGRAKPAEREPRPTAEAALEREFKARHYSEWTRQPVPALGGATPLEAVRRPAGKRRVELLLKEFEHHENRLPAEERFDLSRLRKELGLD